MTRRAVFAGTFDPVHNGHLDLIRRGAMLFDELIVAVARNPGKLPVFSPEERLALIEPHLPGNARAMLSDGLIVDLALQENAAALLRGIRSGTDLDYENQMAALNATMAPAVDTVYLPATASVAAISGTYVRQIAKMGGDVSAFVPANVLEALSVATA